MLFELDRDAELFELALAELEHRCHDIAQPDRRRLRHLAAEALQVSNDRAGAGALLLNQRQIGARRFRHVLLHLQQFGEAEDRLQRVVQLVRDARHQHADRREALLPNHLLLQ